MDINKEIKIKFLMNCQEYIPILANLWYEEISRHWAKDASVEKAVNKLISHLNKDKMPIAIVAVYNDEPIGMACLRETDGVRPGLTPWLGSLVVNPKFRGMKIGEMLIEAIKSLAKKLEHQSLYLLTFDSTIPTWYKKLGWKFIDNDQLLGHQISIMSISL